MFYPSFSFLYIHIIMEYHNMINSIDNISNESSKFRTKNWVEINDELREAYDTNHQIKFETTMWNSSLCDYKKCAPFTYCNFELNNVETDNAKDIDIIMPM